MRVGCFKRTASKHVYYLGWNRSPAQVGCMRQVLRPGALWKPRGIRWRGRRNGGIGMGNTCKPMAVSFQCMTKSTTKKKKKKPKLNTPISLLLKRICLQAPVSQTLLVLCFSSSHVSEAESGEITNLWLKWKYWARLPRLLWIRWSCLLCVTVQLQL